MSSSRNPSVPLRSLPGVALLVTILVQCLSTLTFSPQIGLERWISLGTFFAVILLGLAWSWNHVAPVLTGVWRPLLAFTGLILTAASAALSAPWLAFVGFALSALGCLACVFDRKQGSFLKYSVLLIPFVGFPFSAEPVVQDWLHSVAVETSQRVFRFAAIPFVPSHEGTKFTFGLFDYGAVESYWSSWHFFVLVASIWSLLRNRNFAVCLGNAISAFVWSVGYRTLALVLPPLAAHAELPFAKTMTSPMLTWLPLPVILLLFLSTERAIRGVLAPVADGTGDKRQANPLIAIWNRLDQSSDALNSQDRSRDSNPTSATKRWALASVLSAAALCILLNLASSLGLAFTKADTNTPSATRPATESPAELGA